MKDIDEIIRLSRKHNYDKLIEYLGFMVLLLNLEVIGNIIAYDDYTIDSFLPATYLKFSAHRYWLVGGFYYLIYNCQNILTV